MVVGRAKKKCNHFCKNGEVTFAASLAAVTPTTPFARWRMHLAATCSEAVYI